jgi:hypothetical protein
LMALEIAPPAPVMIKTLPAKIMLYLGLRR